MKTLPTNAQLDRTILLHQRLGDIARVIAPNTPAAKTVRVDDAMLMRSIAKDGFEQRMAAKATTAAAQPVAALRRPSPVATPADVRVAPTSSGAKARGFADRARAAAK